MKKSQELILLAALMAAAVVIPTLSAQDNADRPEGAPPPPHREQMRENMMKMADELGLTPEQRSQVKEIMTASGEQMRAIMDDSTLGRPERREKMMALRKETESKVDAVLTPEQVAKKKELREAHHGKGPGGKKQGKKGPGPSE